MNIIGSQDAFADQLTEERLLAASVSGAKNHYETRFVVPEMHCIACITKIERSLSDLSQVTEVRANLSTKSVIVTWDPAEGAVREISRKLDDLGFEHHVSDEMETSDNGDQIGKSLLLSLAVAGFAAANIMLLSVAVWSGADHEAAGLFHLVSGLIAVPAVFIAGQPFFKSAAKAITAKRLNMDVPISLAVLLALAMSIYESLSGGSEAYFDASVTLLFFLLIGRYLDHLMRQKARGAVKQLSSLSAKDGVLVRKDGSLTRINLEKIKPDMVLRVFMGERLPVNAKIVSGLSEIDRSHVTGEAESISVKTGDVLEAGTVNLTATLDVVALRSAKDSFLSEMRKMMEAAEKGRGEYVRVADRMARIYAPAVHLLAFLTFVFWMLYSGGNWQTSTYTAIAVLIITCPCALGLAVPVAHVIAANRLMKNGIMMREGAALERLADVDFALFDKTGTLTKGKPIVRNTVELTKEQASLLKGMSSVSNHPIAKAVSDCLGQSRATEPDHLSELPGFGVEAVFGGKKARFGRIDWVSEISSAESERGTVDQTTSFAIQDMSPVYFEFHDELRTDAVHAIKQLARQLSNIEILSGDHVSKVSEVAKLLGLSEFRSGQTPAQKIAYVRELKETGRRPLMVGDGINDAPALAEAKVSMVPASASDIGRHSADFIFTGKSLKAVPVALQVAKFTDRVVRQNFGLAIAYNCIAVPLAMAGLVTPLIAAIAMSASSILVIANSFRINFLQLDQQNETMKNAPGYQETQEVLA